MYNRSPRRLFLIEFRLRSSPGRNITTKATVTLPIKILTFGELSIQNINLHIQRPQGDKPIELTFNWLAGWLPLQTIAGVRWRFIFVNISLINILAINKNPRHVEVLISDQFFSNGSQ